MTVTTFYSAKPGQGCSTVAAAAALVAAQVGPTFLASPDPDDLAAILGMPHPEEYPVEVRPGLTLTDEMPEDTDGAAVIIDAGTNPAGATVHGVAYLVTRPCYLALRRAQRLTIRPDGVVLITEPGRALDASDVAEVIGAPIRAELAQDAAVARAIDAGLLASRLPRTLARTVGRLVEPEAAPVTGDEFAANLAALVVAP